MGDIPSPPLSARARSHAPRRAGRTKQWVTATASARAERARAPSRAEVLI